MTSRYDIGVNIDYEVDAEAEQIREDLERIIRSWPGTKHAYVSVYPHASSTAAALYPHAFPSAAALGEIHESPMSFFGREDHGVGSNRPFDRGRG